MTYGASIGWVQQAAAWRDAGMVVGLFWAFREFLLRRAYAQELMRERGRRELLEVATGYTVRQTKELRP
jgi:hypothetical protein